MVRVFRTKRAAGSIAPLRILVLSLLLVLWGLKQMKNIFGPFRNLGLLELKFISGPNLILLGVKGGLDERVHTAPQMIGALLAAGTPQHFYLVHNFLLAKGWFPLAQQISRSYHPIF
jgi:hypothetical protein